MQSEQEQDPVFTEPYNEELRVFDSLCLGAGAPDVST